MDIKRQNYPGIDLFKFIMALFIILLHTQPLADINATGNLIVSSVLGRTAVPFFFVATGFLLYTKINTSKLSTALIIKEYIIKVFKLYLVWTLIYLPMIVYDKIICNESGLLNGIAYTVRDFIFTGSYSHLWYLPASIIGVLLVFYLVRKIGLLYSGFLVTVLYLLGLLAQSYYGLLPMLIQEDGFIWNVLLMLKKVIATSRNGLFFGSFFIYLGVLIAAKNIRLSMVKSIIGIIISYSLFYFEILWLKKLNFIREEDTFLMLIPISIFVILFSLNITYVRNSVFLRRMSMNLYFTHMIFKFIYKNFMEQILPNNIWLFLITMIFSFLVSWLMILFDNSKNKGTRQ